MFKDIDIKFVDKEITPFGGLSLFLKMVERCGFEEVFDRLYHWFFSQLVFDNYTLDFDSTVMVREGEQEGAAKGYNPKRPGRNSHHPILAFVSDIRMIANYWLRPGNTSASTNYLAFLEDTLENLQGKTVGLIRMDSGFFAKEILDHLESRGLQYIVACKYTWPIKRELVRGRVWTEIDDGIEMAETTYQAQSFLKTIRYEFIATPAYFSKSKDKHILYLARSLKTRSAFQGIWNSLDHFSLPYRV